MKLNLGSGRKHMLEDGWINMDSNPAVNPQVVIDFERFGFDSPWQCEHLEKQHGIGDDTVEEIRAEHVLEHIRNIIPLMNWCYRVLKKGGTMTILVPQNQGVWADPSHVRGFSGISFRYYCGYGYPEDLGITARFTQESIVFEENEDGGELRVVLRK